MKMKPGIYKGLSYAKYAEIDAVNHSYLEHFSRSPRHALKSKQSPSEPTEAMVFGSACHCAILEPERFKELYCVAPKVDRRYKEGKNIWEKFVADNKDKEVLTAEQYDECLAMFEAANYLDEAKELLETKGLAEVVIVWTDQETGVACKARMDKLVSFRGTSVILDIKTTKSASYHGFSKACADNGYARQNAWYIDGCRTLSDVPRRFIFLALEKKTMEPALWELDAASVDQGRIENRAWLKQYVECTKTGEWPGYTKGISPLSIPKWAFRPVEEMESKLEEEESNDE